MKKFFKNCKNKKKREGYYIGYVFNGQNLKILSPQTPKIGWWLGVSRAFKKRKKDEVRGYWKHKSFVLIHWSWPIFSCIFSALKMGEMKLKTCIIWWKYYIRVHTRYHFFLFPLCQTLSYALHMHSYVTTSYFDKSVSLVFKVFRGSYPLVSAYTSCNTVSHIKAYFKWWLLF